MDSSLRFQAAGVNPKKHKRTPLLIVDNLEGQSAQVVLVPTPGERKGKKKIFFLTCLCAQEYDIPQESAVLTPGHGAVHSEQAGMQLWRLREAELLCFATSSHRELGHLCEQESPAVQPPAAEDT